MENYQFEKQETVFIYCSAAHRNPLSCLKVLETLAARIYLVQGPNPRTHRVETLRSSVESLNHPEKFETVEGGDISKTIGCILGDPSCKYIVACGSFFLMPYLRGYFESELLEMHITEDV